MASKSKRARMAPQRNLAKTFMYWTIAVLVIKLIIIARIQPYNFKIRGTVFSLNGSWLGADGENYLTGYIGLLTDGVFSNEGILTYWPAGYPLVIFFLSLFGKSWVLTSLAVFQSAIFSYAVYLFASQLARTRLKKFVYLVFILIILNPTLSLSSITVGYESLTASGFLITVGLIIKDFIEKDDKKFIKSLSINSAIFGLLIFMQPRLIVSGILINLFWILIRKGVKLGSLLVIVSLAVTLFFPATLIFRNNKAIGTNTISTNLGVTMMIGAGDDATGGYLKGESSVPCTLTGTGSQRDNQRVKCVLNWYVSNPTKTIKLFYNKTLYFWSPWFGPEANGTMARNPWLTISPIKNLSLIHI